MTCRTDPRFVALRDSLTDNPDMWSPTLRLLADALLALAGSRPAEVPPGFAEPADNCDSLVVADDVPFGSVVRHPATEDNR